MCGIFGFVSTEEGPVEAVFEGLKKLEYRGYDSWGIASALRGAVEISKEVGKLPAKPPALPVARAALGHTRWATTGAVTRGNAHPHTDGTGRFAVVHNGIVENYEELKRELLQLGIVFRSETDTEVIAHLVSLQIQDRADRSLGEAVRIVAEQLEGLNALAVLDAEEEEIVLFKSGSPLYLGSEGGATQFASDPSAIIEFTKDVVSIEDGALVTIKRGGAQFMVAKTGTPYIPATEHLSWTREDTEKGVWPHFLIKEIMEQPAILERCVTDGADRVLGLVPVIKKAGEVHLVGCGSAYYAALIASRAMAQLGNARWHVHYAHEFPFMRPPVNEGDVLLAVSQSGETIDVLESIRAARERGAFIASFVNVPGSTLGRESHFVVPVGAGPEKSVLATKSFTAQVAHLVLTAAAVSGRVDSVSADLRAASAMMRVLASAEHHDRFERLAHYLASQEHIFVLGTPSFLPAALEIALKIKEVSYIHAEALPAGELKHGSLAMVSEGTPCLVVAPDGPEHSRALLAAAQVQARGAWVLGIGSAPDAHFDEHLSVGGAGAGLSLGAIAAGQLIAYRMAVALGLDPDKPRNLAKSVTVR